MYVNKLEINCLFKLELLKGSPVLDCGNTVCVSDETILA